MRCSWSYTPGRDRTSSAASPAVELMGLPLSVPLAQTSFERSIRRASSTAMTSDRPAIAAIGNPPDMALP